ncbi:MAG: helix-turn-helix domain-containing protein [Thermoplasmata archaeon]
MKLRPTKFVVRENTASLRQHASRVASDTRSKIAHFEEERPVAQPTSSRNVPSVKVPENPLHAASHDEATGRDARDGCHLLDVHEVAELLHVPVSWVYGRMRKRSLERLPGYRLGKYWRFRKDEVLAWVDSHCGGSHAA